MQCPKCGAQSSDSIKCDRCGFILDKAKLEESYKRNIPQKNATALVAPPRKVPAFFIISCFSVIRVMIAASVVTSIYFVSGNNNYFGFPPLYTTLFFYIGLGLVGLYSVTSAAKKISLLKNGVAASAQVLEAIPHGTSFTSSSGNTGTSSGQSVYKGWESDTVAIGAQKYRHRLRLTGKDGKSSEFWWKGYEYVGEYYIFDPDNPSRHIRMSDYYLNLRLKDGRWHTWSEDIKYFLIWCIVFGVVCAGAILYASVYRYIP